MLITLSKCYNISVFIVTSLIVSGCASINIQKYSTSNDELIAIKKTLNQPIDFQSVSGKGGDTSTRLVRMAAYLNLPNYETYNKYIEKSFKDSLYLAEKYSKHSPIKMNIVTSYVDFGSTIGHWYIYGDVYINKKKITTIKTDSPYGNSFFGGIAAENAAQAFPNAVSQFISDVFNSKAVYTSINSHKD